MIDSIVHVDHPDTLIELIMYNRSVVAPMLLRPGQAWSNFWGDYTDEGFYQRSTDYMDFVNYNKMLVCKSLSSSGHGDVGFDLGDCSMFHMLHMLI